MGLFCGVSGRHRAELCTPSLVFPSTLLCCFRVPPCSNAKLCSSKSSDKPQVKALPRSHRPRPTRHSQTCSPPCSPAAGSLGHRAAPTSSAEASPGLRSDVVPLGPPWWPDLTLGISAPGLRLAEPQSTSGTLCCGWGVLLIAWQGAGDGARLTQPPGMSVEVLRAPLPMARSRGQGLALLPTGQPWRREGMADTGR